MTEELVSEVQARMLHIAKKGDAIRHGLGSSARNGADGKYMLTGLLRCSLCSGPISSTGRNTFGCSVHHNRGKVACSNDVKFKRDLAEQVVLDAIRTKLFTPTAIERFISLLVEEQAQQSKSAEGAVAALSKVLQEAEKGIAGCLAFIEAGNASPSVAARLADLERKAQETRAALNNEQSARPLTPTELAALKEAGLGALEVLPELLGSAPSETRAVLSQLLGTAIVEPAADKATLEIKMAGQLTGLLTIKALAQRKEAKLVNVVAGARFELATFGL